jgi:hypothetical protein
MRDHVTFQRTLEGEVKVIERLAGREPRGADAAFAAMVLTCRNFTFETRGEELFMRPALGAGALGEAVDGACKRRRFQRSTEIRDVGGRLGRCHYATPNARS